MKHLIIFTFLVILSNYSYSALYARDLDGDMSNGHEGVYDDVLDITWLADANLAASISFGVPRSSGITINSGINSQGNMSSFHANQWIAGMNSYGDGWLGINSWRLPNVEPVNNSYFNFNLSLNGDTDRGLNISAPVHPIYNPNGQSAGFIGNELAYHYYNNLGGENHTTFSNQENLQLFDNIQGGYYLTGVEISIEKIAFTMKYGEQLLQFSSLSFVWAVADGDHGVSAVPIPAAIWLFGSSLVGLFGFRRLKVF